MEVVYRPGLQHKNCDALSRRSCDRDPEKPPCKQCRSEATYESPEAEVCTLKSEAESSAKAM